MGKVLIAIFGVFLLLGAFATPISDGIKTWRTNDTTQSFVVATAVGVTTANVTLSGDLYQNSVAEVEAITSTLVEAPAATTYTEATKVVLLSALTANTSRTLTIHYYAETDNTVMRTIGPFLAILLFGGLLFGLIYPVFNHKRGR